MHICRESYLTKRKDRVGIHWERYNSRQGEEAVWDTIPLPGRSKRCTDRQQKTSNCLCNITGKEARQTQTNREVWWGVWEVPTDQIPAEDSRWGAQVLGRTCPLRALAAGSKWRITIHSIQDCDEYFLQGPKDRQVAKWHIGQRTKPLVRLLPNSAKVQKQEVCNQHWCDKGVSRPPHRQCWDASKKSGL